MDIRNLLRHLQASSNISAIARATGLNRRTILRYRDWAQTHDLLSGPLPSLEHLQHLLASSLPLSPPPQTISSVEPFRALVEQLYAQGVEGTAILQRLKERGYTGAQSSIYRFLHHLDPHRTLPPVRVEREPGIEAQVDFGYAGRMLDPQSGKLRKSWAFVMTLSFSRHQFVEFVFDQSLPTWITLHRHAFSFFGGVPQRVVLDNLKAGIVKACFDDPQVQTTYRECAEHYGFLLAPCRPRTPEHKGKVEQGGVHYVKRNFLGGRTPTSITEANRDVLNWCLTTAGERIHGTTKQQPLRCFQRSEQAQLNPLPELPYDLALWKQASVHRDCYVVFDNAFYSVPFRLVGQRVWVRGGASVVRVYSCSYELLATHTRAQRPGKRLTTLDHLPPEKVPQLTWTREMCRAMAQEVGAATTQLVQTLLDEKVIDRHSRVVRILKLRERVGDERLEGACARALAFEDLSYRTIKGILDQGLETTPPAAPSGGAPPRTFVRTASELLGHVFGGLVWS
jgi:transposase